MCSRDDLPAPLYYRTFNDDALRPEFEAGALDDDFFASRTFCIKSRSSSVIEIE